MGKLPEVKNTILEVAKHAGVSPATVSRVFNNGPYVTDKVRDAVLVTAKKLNYAQKLTKSKSTIGIFLLDINE